MYVYYSGFLGDDAGDEACLVGFVTQEGREMKHDVSLPLCIKPMNAELGVPVSAER